MLDECAFGDEKQVWKRDGIRQVLRQEDECMKAAVRYIEDGDGRASRGWAQLEHGRVGVGVGSCGGCIIGFSLVPDWETYHTRGHCTAVTREKIQALG